MRTTRERRWLARFATALALVSLALIPGCARPVLSPPAGPGSRASENEQQPPFHQDQGQASSDSASLAVPPDAKSPATVPFGAASHSRTLPAGSLLTVQLGASLSPAKARPGEAFRASVAGPVAIDGEIVVAPGTPVTGRVESAKSSVQPGLRSGQVQGRGYVRLTLTAIVVDGKRIPLQTSSLFAQGTARSNASSADHGPDQPFAVRVPKGRRLTFRLTAPLTLSESTAMATLRPAQQ